jgi:hypothetical protein
VGKLLKKKESDEALNEQYKNMMGNILGYLFICNIHQRCPNAAATPT